MCTCMLLIAGTALPPVMDTSQLCVLHQCVIWAFCCELFVWAFQNETPKNKTSNQTSINQAIDLFKSKLWRIFFCIITNRPVSSSYSTINNSINSIIWQYDLRVSNDPPLCVVHIMLVHQLDISWTEQNSSRIPSGSAWALSSCCFFLFVWNYSTTYCVCIT